MYLLLICSSTNADEIKQWRLQTSLYTRHWSFNPEHDNHQNLVAVEMVTRSRWLYGLAVFDNSFGQFSQYVYAGYSWNLFHQDWLYFKVTGGALHGYEKPYLGNAAITVTAGFSLGSDSG